jgi:hypothetical protein
MDIDLDRRITPTIQNFASCDGTNSGGHCCVRKKGIASSDATTKFFESWDTAKGMVVKTGSEEPTGFGLVGGQSIAPLQASCPSTPI